MAQKNKMQAKASSKSGKSSAGSAKKISKVTKPAQGRLTSSKTASRKLSAADVKAKRRNLIDVAAKAKKPAPAKIQVTQAPRAKPAAAAPATPSVRAIVKPGLAHGAGRPITVPATARAVPAALAKAGGQKITAPVAPATPKAIAEKAAAARQLMAAQKKPVSQRHGFKTNEFVVYPAHGVGRIIGIEEQEIAGMALELFVINFDKEKLTLRVPTGKLASVGMRKLADEGIVKKAMDTLKGRARVKRTMWSRRAQEYVAKINSGDLISIAEVVRDLYRSEAQPEQSYSERQLYEDALDRMAREIAAVEKLDERGAVQRITDVLSKSARGRRVAEGAEAEVKAA
jgi:CarD family transcriptional regulator